MSSMIDTETAQEIQDNDGKKNKAKICCRFCPSVILNVGASTFISHEFPLPHIRTEGKDKDLKMEIIKDYWLVDKGLYDFENVSITKTVNQTQYLACADCEVGPIGYIDHAAKKYYVAISRVMYENEESEKSNELDEPTE